MSIQKIEISKLMDNYTDEEFFIEGKAAANAKAVTAKVTEQTAPKSKLRLRTKALLIAAAVGVTGLLTAAVMPYGLLESSIGTRYEFSDHTVEINSPGMGTNTNTRIQPYTEENGRIFFTADNQNIDIIDYFERGENYYYKYSDTDSQGVKYDIVLAVGGSIDDPSYGEMIFEIKDEPSFFPPRAASSFYNSGDVYCYYKDGEVVLVDTPEKREESTSYPFRDLNFACLAEFNYYRNLWDKDVSAGREIDVNSVDRSLTFEREYTDWLYPEGWSGERISNDIPELPDPTAIR